MAQHNQLGKKGEQLAVDFLLKKGYEIVERNFRFEKAELDIIAQYNDTLAIVEVKTRSTNEFGPPETSINQQKREHMIAAALAYLQTYINSDIDWRIDVICHH